MIKLSNGNSKLGKGVHIFNITPQVTCIGSTVQCRKACYAMKAQRMYPATRNQRDNNLNESYQDTFVSEMTGLLKENKFITYFRIHESGDFYSQEYLNKWVSIAKGNKKVKFLAYTKSFNLDFSQCPKNLTIMLSLFPDSPTIPEHMQHLPIAYAGDCESMKKTFKCVGTCASCVKCWGTKKNVFFSIH
jgi:hypothetical protein